MDRTRTLALCLAASLLGGAGTALASVDTPTSGPTVTAIASLDAVPNATVTQILRGLGLEVQPMRHLPLAIVRGPAAAVDAIETTGLGDVYANEPIQLLDTASSDSMGAAGPRAEGLTGAGVTVGVVDSGCDGGHPDLADHITHNVKLVSAEYANIPPDSSNTIVLPLAEAPTANTDIGSGHGTHVAGIIAADGTTSPDHLGVAPDAELVCLAIGEVLFTTAVVTAYDYLLDQPDLLGVDVINNSWGNLYAQYDPRNPVAVATRAVADHGVSVVFAAGNSGSVNGEATLNPFSQTPWVLSVAAATLEHERGSFSSNGLVVDNSDGVAIGPGGHTVFTGERIGMVHPDVTAPGVDISSSCDTAGVAVGPCPPGENIEASGTSMASPHVAGAVAVLRQANPNLTIDQIRWVLQTTADPVIALDDADEPTGEPAPFWQVGYGHVDLAEAVDVVQDRNALRNLERRQRALNTEVLAGTGYRVLRSDWFTYDAPRASLGGSDARTYEVPRVVGANHLHVTVAFPSTAAVTDTGITMYTVNVLDAAGTVVATTERAGEGSASVLAPVSGSGAYTVEVVGDVSVSDPDTLDSDSLLNDTVTVVVAQLASR